MRETISSPYPHEDEVHHTAMSHISTRRTPKMATPHRRTFDEHYRTLTPFQKSLHAPSDPSLGEDHPQNRVHTPFYNAFAKGTWYYHYSERLAAMFDATTDTIVFTAGSTPHSLLYTDLVQELPAVVTAPVEVETLINDKRVLRYEAKWCHNVGSNIMIDATLRFNDQELQWMDYIGNDMFFQSMVTPEERHNHNVDIGNIPSLQKWSTSLKQYTCSFSMPWYYALKDGAAFPLYDCGLLDRLTHHIKLRTRVADLLRVRAVLEDGTFIKVPFNSITVKSVGRARGQEDLRLGQPMMMGEYAFLGDLETGYHRAAHVPQVMRLTLLRTAMFINTMIAFTSTDDRHGGQVATVEIKDAQHNVHTYMWAAQNLQMLEEGEYSVYADTDDVTSQDTSPIGETTLHSGRGIVLANMPAYRTERVVPRHHFKAVPDRSGFNVWTHATQIRDGYAPPGIHVQGGRLDVTLKPCEGTYRLHLRCVYLRRVMFQTAPETDERRASTGAILTITDL